MTASDDFLAHYGVRGMKWGVRKRSGGSGGAKRSTLLAPKVTMNSEDAVRFAEIKAKARQHGTSSLSNDELRVVTDRMGLENKYSQLFPGPVKKPNPVVKFFVQDVLVKTGKSLVQEVAKSQGQALLIDKGLINKKGKDDADKKAAAEKEEKK